MMPWPYLCLGIKIIISNLFPKWDLILIEVLSIINDIYFAIIVNYRLVFIKVWNVSVQSDKI